MSAFPSKADIGEPGRHVRLMPLRSRRRSRHRRSPDRTMAVGAARAAIHYREPARRRRQYRHRSGRARASRRLHAAPGRRLERQIAEAQKIVAIWNARQAGGRALWFYPTIGAATAAGIPWLSFSCPACGQVGSVDLRTLDRHPGGAISGLIPSLSCCRCSPNAPLARLEMLTAERP